MILDQMDAKPKINSGSEHPLVSVLCCVRFISQIEVFEPRIENKPIKPQRTDDPVKQKKGGEESLL